MRQYNVTGMSCAACQTRVEKAVCAVEGVEACAVNLLTNSMGVEGTADANAIIQAVEKAGYGASLKRKSGNTKIEEKDRDGLHIKEINGMTYRLISSFLLLLPLMYVSMGHMLWNWPLPPLLEGNHLAMGLYELLLSSLIMVINQRFFLSGFRGLMNKSPNMDTLVAIGATASYVYSVYALFAMTDAVVKQQAEAVSYYMDQFYFESAATILTLITLGKVLEAHAKGKTTNALKSLMNLSPKSAVLLVNKEEQEVSIEEVKVGDYFVVRPGDAIPVDGIVIEGESAVNEAALTGESLPAEKKMGDKIWAATINTSGYMICQATQVGEDTTFSTIIQMVSDAAATKAPIAKIADRVSGVFVPVVICISLITFFIWLLSGQSFGYAIARAVSVLVISCPCALGLATPVAIMVGNGVAAKSGILFKNATALEQAGKTQIVALDKTGTITSGCMTVTDIIPADKISEQELVSIAYSLEAKSEHPIAKAIMSYGQEHELPLVEINNFEVVSGNGLRANYNLEEVFGGNQEYIEKITGPLKADIESRLHQLSSQGKTAILFVKANTLLGIIAVADTIKKDSSQGIAQLKAMGIHVIMLTGDNEITARVIGEQSGVDEIVASVKPDEKALTVQSLQEYGIVTMVGDGINDAPALTQADLGIAIGAGTDIAVDAADVVLVNNSICDIAAAIRISRATLKNIHENLFWAFFYNAIGIPLAAGCYVALLGWSLNPMFAAAAMGLSSFCVVTNALRLNFIKPYDSTKDKKVKHPITGKLIKENKTTKRKEEYIMKISVNGMMCGHCEAHVKKALEAIEGIETVLASHQENLVTITTSKEVDELAIKAAIEEAGYEYVGILQ